MATQEQLEDDDTGKALTLAAFHKIDREHVKAYCSLVFDTPKELTPARRKALMDTLFTFANLGWCTFHAMNRGMPLKERNTKRAAKPKVKAKK